MSATMRLINTGILMGIVHVLTGPDHLSALATLSGIDISASHSKRLGSNFLLGIKWGLGHSMGLLVVGGLLIVMEEEEGEWIDANDEWSRTFEWFVGSFMLLLGFYGLHKACRNKREAASASPLHSRSPSKEDLRIQRGLEEEDDSIFQNAAGDMGPSAHNRRASMEIIHQMAEVLNRDGDSMRGSGMNGMRRGSDSLSSIPENPERSEMDDVEARILHAAQSLRRNSDENTEDQTDEQFMRTLKASAKGALSRSFVSILTNERPAMNASQFVHKHAAPENSMAVEAVTQTERATLMNRLCCYCNMCITPDVLALLAGIVHGVAGPGGVLGVIPAVQLRDAKLASVYLSTFCLTSTLVMGGFAAFYGTFGGWLAGGGNGGRGEYSKRAFIVEAGSASLSVAVGVVWLVLLTVGKLQEVFP